MRINTSSRIALLACMAVILSACGGSDAADPATTGSITLGITDTPVAEAGKVVVRFTGVEIIAAEGSGLENQTFTFTEAKTIDLLALQGGLRDTLLEDQSLPAGDYGQIRLMVQAEHDGTMDSYIEINGAQHELRVPSGSQTGLKLVHELDVAADSSTDLTIDFDLRKSVVLAGSVYMLKPALRLVETETAGELTGIVDPSVFAGVTCDASPLEGYSVYVYEGHGVTPDDLGSGTPPLASVGVTLDETSVRYVYTVGFLAPGNYTVAATCHGNLDETEAGDDDVVLVAPADVVVTAGAPVTHNFE